MANTLRYLALMMALVWTASAQAAGTVDSYRYLHVTIETPWTIFLLLAPMVLLPMVLMGILVWRYAERRKGETEEKSAEGSQE